MGLHPSKNVERKLSRMYSRTPGTASSANLQQQRQNELPSCSDKYKFSDQPAKCPKSARRRPRPTEESPVESIARCSSMKELKASKSSAAALSESRVLPLPNVGIRLGAEHDSRDDFRYQDGVRFGAACSDEQEEEQEDRGDDTDDHAEPPQLLDRLQGRKEYWSVSWLSALDCDASSSIPGNSSRSFSVDSETSETVSARSTRDLK